MFLCGNFDEVDRTEWEWKEAADKKYANTKMHFTTKYKEKMLYCEVMAQQLGYVNQAKEMWSKNCWR